MASGRLEVSLSLANKRASKSQLGSVLLLACSGIWRFSLVLPASKWTKQPARESSLMAFIISLQSTLWRSVIILEMIVFWHPDRIWRALSACWQSEHLRLVDTLKRKAFLKGTCVVVEDITLHVEIEFGHVPKKRC